LQEKVGSPLDAAAEEEEGAVASVDVKGLPSLTVKNKKKPAPA
jgi:hypothetical protein